MNDKLLTPTYVAESVIAMICNDSFWREWQDYLKPELFTPRERPLAEAILNIRISGGDYINVLAHFSSNGSKKVANNVTEWLDNPEALKFATVGMKDISGIDKIEAKQAALKQKTKILAVPKLVGITLPDCDDFSACPVLGDYVELSQKWSPDSPTSYHIACGIFMLSAIAAGRVKIIGLASKLKTQLYIAVAGDSAEWAKTTCTNIVEDTIKNVANNKEYPCKSMQYLLNTRWPGSPEVFLHCRTTRYLKLDNYDFNNEEHARELTNRAMFIGQQSWYHDEFGRRLSMLRNSDATVNGIKTPLLKAYDGDDIGSESMSRGLDEVINPYISLLTDFTYADVWGMLGNTLWYDGLLGRFMFVTPLDAQVTNNRMPLNEEFEVPYNIIKTLAMWHNQLGLPEVLLKGDEDNSVEDKRKKLKKSIEVGELPLQKVYITTPMQNRVYEYRGAIRKSYANSDLPPDLKSTYNRMIINVVKMAALFASINATKADEHIEVLDNHFDLAATLMEYYFKPSLHELHEHTDKKVSTGETRVEIAKKAGKNGKDRLLAMLDKGSLTASQLQRGSHFYFNNVNETKIALDELITDGKLILENKLYKIV